MIPPNTNAFIFRELVLNITQRSTPHLTLNPAPEARDDTDTPTHRAQRYNQNSTPENNPDAKQSRHRQPVGIATNQLLKYWRNLTDINI